MNSYLSHHGIKGQKWGIRRFQNDDGTLTPEGRERYGNSQDYSYKDKAGGAGAVARKAAKSSFLGRKHLAEHRVASLEEKAKAARDAGDEKNAEKYERRQQAQAAANANRKAYEDHTSTKKLIAQDVFLTKYGAQNYRAARARGAGRLRALLETGAGITPVATILAMSGNKKKYGSRLVLSGLNDGRSL